MSKKTLSAEEKEILRTFIENYLSKWLKIIGTANILAIAGLFFYTHLETPRWLAEREVNLKALDDSVAVINYRLGESLEDLKGLEIDIDSLLSDDSAEKISSVAHAASVIAGVKKLSDFNDLVIDLHEKIDRINFEPRSKTIDLVRKVNCRENEKFACPQGYIVTKIHSSGSENECVNIVTCSQIFKS